MDTLILLLALTLTNLGILILLILTVSYTHLRAHETKANLVCRLLLEKKNLPSFLPSHERDESIVLFRDVKKKSREEAEDRDFSLLYPRKVLQ